MNSVAVDRFESDCLLRPGSTNCGGCGMSMGLTLLGRALAGERYSLVIPACCGIVTAGAFPTTSYNVPVVASTFASAPAFASGVAAVAELNAATNGRTHVPKQEPADGLTDGPPDTSTEPPAEHTICWAGDGGTYDIGLATLSAAAERNENLLYFCYDNEIYGNTGGQRSSATPATAVTATTPSGKGEGKKDIVGIMAAHGIPYAATLSIAHPEDFQAKVQKALGVPGFRFFLIHAPCPTGWKTEPAETVELVRLAVRSGVFPLYEVSGGVDWRINVEPDGTDPAEYYRKQRRFGRKDIDMDGLRAAVAERGERLRRLAGSFGA